MVFVCEVKDKVGRSVCQESSVILALANFT
jgi:hypothetical protein